MGYPRDGFGPRLYDEVTLDFPGQIWIGEPASDADPGAGIVSFFGWSGTVVVSRLDGDPVTFAEGTLYSTATTNRSPLMILPADSADRTPLSVTAYQGAHYLVLWSEEGGLATIHSSSDPSIPGEQVGAVFLFPGEPQIFAVERPRGTRWLTVAGAHHSLTTFSGNDIVQR